MKPQCPYHNPVSVQSPRSIPRPPPVLGTGVSSVVDRTRARQHYYIISDQGSNKMHTDELQLVLWSGAASLLASRTGVILTPRVVISHPVVIRTLCYIIRNNDPL